MTKVHLHANETTSTVAACGRYLGTKGRSAQAAAYRRVTCLNCRQSETYLAAKAVWEAAEKAAFAAQTPREVQTLFGNDLVCACGNRTFREKPRNLTSFHYVCSECGMNLHPLTETGMCS
jgi:ferredoxin-like protein FixX